MVLRGAIRYENAVGLADDVLNCGMTLALACEDLYREYLREYRRYKGTENKDLFGRNVHMCRIVCQAGKRSDWC